MAYLFTYLQQGIAKPEKIYMGCSGDKCFCCDCSLNGKECFCFEHDNYLICFNENECNLRTRGLLDL